MKAWIKQHYIFSKYTYEDTTFYIYKYDNDRTTLANGELFAEEDGWEAIKEWKKQFVNKRYRI